MFGLESYYVKENEKLIRYCSKIYMIIDKRFGKKQLCMLVRKHQNNSKMVSLWLPTPIK